MSAKIQIPDALKADIPQNRWGKVLAATPVVMTVIATLLAGLSSGEMTRAQYDRSLAAQKQSKAGDQWSYFQAKRLRAAMQRSTLDVLRNVSGARPLDAAALTAKLEGTPAQAILASDAGRTALACLSKGRLPSTAPEQPLDPRIVSSLNSTEEEGAPLSPPLKPAEIEAALKIANARVRAADDALKPVTQAVDAVEAELAKSAAGAADPLLRDFAAARVNLAALRYDSESRQNQVIAQLYELQVSQGNVSAEHHHTRSQRFFYGMLAAQLAVIVSTLSIAAQKRNFLWAVAATAGTAAVGFAAYVYLFV